MNYVSPRMQIEALLAVERAFVPQPDDIRARALRRARAAVPRSLYVQQPVTSSSPRRPLAVGKVAAAALVLSTLCSAAFYAGYEVKTSAVPATAPATAASGAATARSHSLTVSKPVPLRVSPVPSCAPAAAATAPEPTRRASLPPRSAPAAEAKQSDVHAAELRVLQPAQLAVARQDYATALAAIASHRHQFPSGRLAEEREALRVKALLGLGRVAEAERASVAFQKRFPHSALRRRMNAMLETQK